MCIFKAPKPAALPAPPPIQPRLSNQAAVKGSRIPEKKELTDPDEVADVSYGSQKKQTSASKRTGTAALSIPLNTGTTGSKTRGLNV